MILVRAADGMPHHYYTRTDRLAWVVVDRAHCDRPILAQRMVSTITRGPSEVWQEIPTMHMFKPDPALDGPTGPCKPKSKKRSK